MKKKTYLMIMVHDTVTPEHLANHDVCSTGHLNYE